MFGLFEQCFRWKCLQTSQQFCHIIRTTFPSCICREGRDFPAASTHACAWQRWWEKVLCSNHDAVTLFGTAKCNTDICFVSLTSKAKGLIISPAGLITSTYLLRITRYVMKPSYSCLLTFTELISIYIFFQDFLYMLWHLKFECPSVWHNILQMPCLSSVCIHRQV